MGQPLLSFKKMFSRFFLYMLREAEDDTIPVFQTIEKLKRVETASACSQNCNQDPDCEFYKWKVIHTKRHV